MTIDRGENQPRRLPAKLVALVLLAGGLLLGWLALDRINAVYGSSPRRESREIPLVGLAEAQRQLAFRLPEPEWLPSGVSLIGARADPPNWGSVLYGRPNSETGGLTIEVTQGKVEGTYAYPQPARQAVRVNNQPAVFVHGAWNERGDWNESADVATLEWATKKMAVHISASGLGLSQLDLIRVAENLWW